MERSLFRHTRNSWYTYVIPIAYYTHDNGGQPFIIDISESNIINVYKAQYNEINPARGQLVTCNEALEVFVGECPYNGEIGNTMLYLYHICKERGEYN